MESSNDKNSKQIILKSALKLFANKGFDGTSIREICNDAGVNICMISYYWGGKQELYNAIIKELIFRQSEYAKTFLDFETEPQTLDKKSQIDLLLLITDKIIDFFYANITDDLILFLLKEQQNPNSTAQSPVINYIKRLLAAIFEKDENDRQIVFKTIFIISQINSPRIMPAFSLRLLGQDDFSPDDIIIIKENVKMYIKAMLKEANIG